MGGAKPLPERPYRWCKPQAGDLSRRTVRRELRAEVHNKVQLLVLLAESRIGSELQASQARVVVQPGLGAVAYFRDLSEP